VSNDISLVSSTAAMKLLSGESEQDIAVELLAEDPTSLGNLIIVNNTASDLVCEVALS
jgi:translation initiation factor 6 (eIF-6)